MWPNEPSTIIWGGAAIPDIFSIEIKVEKSQVKYINTLPLHPELRVCRLCGT